MDGLEEFVLDNYEVTGSVCPRVYAELESWPEELALLRDLQAKLSFVSLVDYEVPEWAAFPPPGVHRCWLKPEFHGRFGQWKALDAFPGLENLRVQSPGTRELVDWALRNLKELSMDGAYFNLDQADFAAVREKIEQQNLKVRTELYDNEPPSPEEQVKWRAELEFWKTVKNAEVTGFEI